MWPWGDMYVDLGMLFCECMEIVGEECAVTKGYKSDMDMMAACVSRLTSYRAMIPPSHNSGSPDACIEG